MYSRGGMLEGMVSVSCPLELLPEGGRDRGDTARAALAFLWEGVVRTAQSTNWTLRPSGREGGAEWSVAQCLAQSSSLLSPVAHSPGLSCPCPLLSTAVFLQRSAVSL